MIDENKFWQLLDTWKRDIRYTSSATEILTHSSVNGLVAMGQESIPLVLKALKGHWYLAYVLHKLTGEWPVKDELAGLESKIVDCWMRWASKHGYKVEK